jgi:hypothetical protein
MRRFALMTIAAELLVWFCVAPARATPFQTFVSGSGSDANPCTRAAPCANFSAALALTNAGGEVDCIDNLGAATGPAVTISKSVTIDCSGAAASFLNATDAITINIAPGDAFQMVRLRGFSINGVGQGTRGISIVAAGSVILEDMEIINETQQAVADVRTTGGLLLIRNSVVAKNTGAGIAIAATGGPYGATLENVHSFKNGFGLAVGSGNNVMVTRSILSGNSVSGLEMDAGAQVVLDNSIVNFNPTGLQSSGFLTLMGSTISFNNVAISGASNSFGDNKIFGNSSPGTAPTVGTASTDHSKQ